MIGKARAGVLPCQRILREAAVEGVRAAGAVGDVEEAADVPVVGAGLQGVAPNQEREGIPGLVHLRDLEVWQEGRLANVREAADRDPRQAGYPWDVGDAAKPEVGWELVGDERIQVVVDPVVADAQFVDAAGAEHLGLADRQVVRLLHLDRLLEEGRAD